MAPGAAGEGPGTDEFGETVRARLAEYTELWTAAGAKLSAGAYTPRDAVADWVRWAGMAAEDAMTAASCALDAMPRVPPREDRPGGAVPPDADDSPAGGG
jgi:hypothetical protein